VVITYPEEVSCRHFRGLRRVAIHEPVPCVIWSLVRLTPNEPSFPAVRTGFLDRPKARKSASGGASGSASRKLHAGTRCQESM